MQLVVVSAVRKAVRAATNTFTSISMVDLFFIGSEDPPGPLNAPPLGEEQRFRPLHTHTLEGVGISVSSGGQAG